MTLRTRQDKRPLRGGLLRSGGARRDAAAVEHGVRERPLSGAARLVSAVIVLGMILALLLFFLADPFYVRGAVVDGQEFLTPSDVYTIAGIDGWHLFWLDAAAVRQRLVEYPTIADAAVNIDWPPNMVQITIAEREPALVWDQAGVTVWIDLQGRVMRQSADVTGLIRIVAEAPSGDPLTPNTRLPVDVVSGALQLRDLLPTLETLRYDADKGLGYNDPRGWEAWFGTGANMPEKMLIYNALAADAQARGVLPSEINISDPDSPFACCWTP
jgi:hypothetical protein